MDEDYQTAKDPMLRSDRTFVANQKILVVEDNSADIYLLRWALEELDEAFEVDVVTDGAKAIRFIQAQHERSRDTDPCVIVLDLHIPKYDGIEVLSFIRREPVMAHIPVVFLTTAASPREEAEIIRLGADYRLKPVDLNGYSALASDLISICKGLVVPA